MVAAANPNPGEDKKTLRYRAFISYSHAAMRKLAPALQAGLHRFARPWYKLRALTVFRDNSDLSASPGLWAGIEEALLVSEYFVLLASPEAAQSKWVAREVEFWLSKRPPGTLLLIQTKGEIVWSDAAGDFDWASTDALPRTLEGAFEQEPFMPDLRWAREADDLSLTNPRFRDAIATLAAKLHGRPKNEMIGDDVREHHRTMRLAWSGVAVLTVMLIASLVAGGIAIQQRNEALRQSQIALARQLNAQAELARDRELDQLPLSTLLAVESLRRLPTPAADETLRANLALLPGIVSSHAINSSYWPRPSEDGEIVFWRDGERLTLTNALTGEVVRTWEAPNEVEVRISRNRTHFAVADVGSFSGDSEETHHALVRDISTGAIVGRVPYQHGITSFSFSPDARFVAFARNKTLRLWEIAADTEAYRFEHDGFIRDYEFSPNADLVAVTTTRGFYLWNLVDGQLVLHQESGDAVSASFREGGDLVAFAATEDYSVHFYNSQTGELITTLITDSKPERLKFSPAGDRIGISGDDGSVTLWDLSDLSQKLRLQMTDDDDLFLGFSGDGSLFATSGGIATQIWDATSGREVARIAKEFGDSNERGVFVAWGRAGNRIGLASKRAVTVFEPLPGSFVHAIDHSGQVKAVSFSSDGVLMASGSWDNTVSVWNTEQHKEHALLVHRGTVEEAAFTADGQYLVSATYDGVFRFWDTDFETETLIKRGDGSQVRYLKADDDDLRFNLGGAPFDLALSPDGKLLATSSTKTGLRIWSIETQLELTPPAVDNEVYGVDFDPTGALLATAEGASQTSEDGQVSKTGLARVWRWETGEELIRLPHDHSVGRVTFSPDGKYLATASRDTVWIWDRVSGKQLKKLVHQRPVNAVTFDPSATRVVTATGPTIVRAGPHLVTVWDLETGRELVRIDHSMAVFDVAVSPDGRYIGSASMDRFAYLWLWKPGDLIREACSRVTRNLTADEWARFLGSEPYQETCPTLGGVETRDRSD